MAKIVMKFGGTSVADLERIRHVATLVKREVDLGNQVAVVVSAMAGETNKLVGWTRELSPLHDAREYDVVVAAGEQITAGLLAVALSAIGVSARSWMGWQIPVHTSAMHGSARIESIESELLNERLAQGQVAVVAGFQGIAADNRISTLGRGGSDTSAVAVAAAIQADRCDIYRCGRCLHDRPAHCAKASGWNASPLRRCWKWHLLAEVLRRARSRLPCVPCAGACAFNLYPRNRGNPVVRRGRHRGKETGLRYRL